VKSGQAGEEEGVEDVISALAHAHDQRLRRAWHGPLRLGHGRQGGQQVAGVRRPACGDDRNRWWVDRRRWPPRRTGAQSFEDFGRGCLHDGSMLADVEARTGETEGTHLTAQLSQVAIRHGSAMVSTEADVEQVEVVAQPVN
jgi:hypothetical protein